MAIVIHNYRRRLGLAEGEAKYDDLEKRLAAGPVIAVPTVTLGGDANGAPHPEAGSYAKKFSGRYARRLIRGGVGHNLPQEAPEAFARAVKLANWHPLSVVDGNLITGQNPASSTSAAQSLMKLLGERAAQASA